ncbi:bifunctional amino acid transporter/iron-containing alcohol dehydrogenase [Hespellia stercorisuis]|uniref:Amino acid/polyamine/organocation transporter, APC superfamily (TC 2.A.3) n=1 Tax=Hespellia stercorisuis DSM 15480 TaxID=1121950 RepID=A0A1M6K8M4_9FIRM|nr:bifunctional amino acid transporter/iron-containing alcohol dehydrogenase [Hespellia stercorisuis]SHJ55200.1 amino acid/polyamine/organocation transporter, APC superfamily (TC 2.A.3) [Hespellia stercorisuis DSM 15480]
MEKKKSEFDKVFSAWDILVIAFGAMIGWGWVVSSGDWIARGGVLGAALGFAIGGVMIFFVGLTYAELTAAMPQCGGEHVFSYKAMGPIGSYICTWAIILGYVSVVCFEACALPTIVTYIYPGFLKGYLYTVAGFDVYASWLAVAIVVAGFITYINVRGAKTAATLQTVLTVIIGGVGILLIVASAVTGDIGNLQGQLFVGNTAGGILKTTMSVALVTPFFFIGFDVIPQAAEEINVPLKKIGKIMILSIVLAVSFYALIIIGVGYIMSASDIVASQSGSGLVTADAMGKAFNSSIMAKVLIVGGMCGIVTSWNSFLIGGSRAMYSMAESYMIPRVFVKLHDKYKTPTNALYLIGGLSMIAPFFGRKMLVWIVDAGNFGCCLAYCMVAISFVILRTKAPEMARPYRVKNYKLVGAVAILMSGLMVAMYAIPNSGCTLVWQEWVMAGGWSVLGVIFCIVCKLKYKEKFGSHIDVALDEDEVYVRDDVDEALEAALATAGTAEEAADLTSKEAARPSMDFSYFLPVNIVFGWGKARQAGELTKPYGRKALIVTGKSSAKKSGLYDKVKQSLDAAGIASELYDQVAQNPLTTTAEDGAAFARASGCDCVVAIGGGSIMDCAKAIAFLAVNEGDVNDYIFNRKTSDRALPLVLIPTTCGTGSEGNGFAVLTNPETGDKKSLRCNAIVAKVSIVDPECMTTMPKKVLASVGFDALCHSMEAYTSKIAQPFTDALCEYAMGLIADNLVDVYRGSEDKSAWEKITLASTIGGMVINTAGVTLAHGMEHPASGLKDIVHGKGLAALTPVVIEASYKGDHFKYAKIARIFGGVTAEDCAAKIRTLIFNLDLTCRLSELGLTESDIPWMAENCMKVSAAGVANNPVVFTQDEIGEIYRRAM